ncbi:hypothetical protein CSO01_35390 [Cellulomonas soli]|uniref:Uncharacterized protein n=1 Tax=Cellulomonas soli TaxID=931535 RepID=A0A512PHZ5_9CELL|nr:hypothetical protein CSO01_35390 [Cellulomonas soli]
MVERAVRVLPADQRERYAEEWRHDVGAAPDPVAARLVARAARAMARRLRRRRLSLILLGQRGFAAFLVSWLAVLGLLAVSSLVGALGLVVAGVLLVVVVRGLLDAGAGGRTVKGWAVGSLVVGVGAFGYLVWAWSVGFDAVDAGRSTPAAAEHGTLAGVVLLLSIPCFIAAVVASLRAAPRG